MPTMVEGTGAGSLEGESNTKMTWNNFARGCWVVEQDALLPARTRHTS